MKIMFILGNYLPKPYANGICIDNLVRELQRRNHMVTCICDKKFYHKDSHEKIDGINIVRVCPEPIVEKIDELNEKTGSKIPVMLLEIVKKISRVFSMCLWPHDINLRALRLYNAANKIFQQEEYDILVCVNGPHASLMAGYWLKKKYPKTVYVPYFLDAFAGGPKGFGISAERDLKRKLAFESKYLECADLTIYMKSSMKFHERYDQGKKHYKTIQYLDIPQILLNGKATVLTSRVKKILYAGTISKKIRNPEYALDIFSKVKNLDFKLTFVGVNDCPEIFERYKAILGDKLEVISQVPYSEMKKMLMEADCFLNLGNLNVNMTPSKIFEYMTYKKPIISFYVSENDTSIHYLNKYPMALQLNQSQGDFDANVVNLKKWLMSDFSEAAYSFKLKDLFYENTPEAFAELLEKQVKEGNKYEQ